LECDGIAEDLECENLAELVNLVCGECGMKQIWNMEDLECGKFGFCRM
jgi:hypothetical protein